MSRYPLIITIAVVLTCLGGEASARRVSEQTVLNACGKSLKVAQDGSKGCVRCVRVGVQSRCVEYHCTAGGICSENVAEAARPPGGVSPGGTPPRGPRPTVPGAPTTVR